MLKGDLGVSYNISQEIPGFTVDSEQITDLYQNRWICSYSRCSGRIDPWTDRSSQA